MPDSRVRSRTPFTRARSGFSLARVALAVTALGALACREPLSPTASAPRLTPTAAMRTLTGASSTVIFVVDPNDIQPPTGNGLALNNSGQVTGTAFNLPGNNSGGDGKPYRWTPGSAPVHIDGTLPGTAFGLDINDAGVIAGWTQNGAGGIRGFRAAGTAAVILDTLPGTFQVDGFTRAVAINASGQIVGEAVPATGYVHAVLWNASNAILDLGTLGGNSSTAIDINDAGQVIGSSLLADNSTTHFFLWSSATGMQDISPLLGGATSILAINSSGQIAGTMATNGGSHAFLYTPGSGVRDLGTLGGTSSSPTGLNNLGQVVGSSTTAGGATHSFLWTSADGMEDITAKTGVVGVHTLNDHLQTLIGPVQNASGNGTNGPQLVQLAVTASNQAPVASFSVNCPALQCTFDGSSSTDDAGIVRYSWSWGTGQSESHSFPVSKHTYAAPGTYTVTLTVTDAQGSTGAVTRSVTVPTAAPNQVPNVSISSPTQPYFTQGQSIAFAGSAIDPEDGALTGASLVWTSNLDGQIGTGTSFSTTSLSVGTHTITLTATDSKGAKNAAAIQVVVDPAPPANPIAVIGSYTCSGQAYPHQCSFDASASSDDKGIVSYTWDWGNGRSETRKGSTARNTWASAGTYVVTLTVTDADGLTGSTQVSVNVP
jgi:probable HAF family extracellular repeat protein